MARPAPPPVHDPDLDPPRLRRAERLEPESLRLLGNPFLGFIFLGFWFRAVWVTLRDRNVILLPLLLIALLGAAFLFQYHCLDCGATDSLFRWKDHDCLGARRRQARARRPWFARFPNPASQTLLWTYLLLAVALLTFILCGLPREGW